MKDLEANKTKQNERGSQMKKTTASTNQPNTKKRIIKNNIVVSLSKVTTCFVLVMALIVAAACGGGAITLDADTRDTLNIGAAANTPGSTHNAGVLGERNVGRYVEHDITPPTDALAFVVTQDDAIIAFSEGLRTRFDSTDYGASWQTSPGPGGDGDRFESVQSMSILPDGRLLVFMNGYGLLAVSNDGTTEHIPNASLDAGIADGDDFNVNFLQVLPDGNIMIRYSVDWIARFMREHDMENFIGPDMFQDEDETNDIIYEETDAEYDEDADDDEANDEDEDTENMASGGTVNRWSVAEGGGQRVVEGGRAVRQSTVSGVGGSSMMIGGMDVFAIYNQSGQQLQEFHEFMGISFYGITHDGHPIAMMEQNLISIEDINNFNTLVAGSAFAFASQNTMVRTVDMINQDCLIIKVQTIDFEAMAVSGRLLRYTWDETAITDTNQTITIWALHDNPLVRAAITTLWQNNPNADITFEVALTGDDAVTASDAIRTLNTQLLSGRGPDIIILDGLPLDAYAGRGMLLNLAGRVDTGDVYANLLAAYTTSGAQYVIPTQFSIPMLMGAAEHMDLATDLQTLVAMIEAGNPVPAMRMTAGPLGGTPYEDRAVISFNDFDELFDTLWNVSANELIVNNRVNTDALREFLSAAQRIAQKYNLSAPSEYGMMGQVGVFVSASGGGGGMNQRANMISGSVMQFMMETTHLAAHTLDSVMLIQTLLRRDGVELSQFPGLTEGAWVPSTLVGVSADTQVQDFAIEFINTMLSLEIQIMNHGLGLPVSQAAVQAQIDQINQTFSEMGMPEFELDIDAIVAGLTSPVFLETTIRNTILGAALQLAEGRLDLEGAVQAIEQNLRTYLAERS